jgi:hypothetical protein
MARVSQRGIKVLFLARPQMLEHTNAVDEVLETPALAEDVVAKVALMGWTPPDGIGVPKWRC